jgi:hypothetical protein
MEIRFLSKKRRRRKRVNVARVSLIRTSSAGGSPMLKRDLATTLESPQSVDPIRI